MKRVVLISTVLISALFGGEVTSIEEKFTSMCMEEHSSGYNWNGTDWKPTIFKPENHIVRKINDTDNCKSITLRDSQISQERTGCYVINKFGIEDYNIVTTCNEFWMKQNNKLTLESVMCFNDDYHPIDYKFNPTGYFSRSVNFSIIWAKKGDKYLDSMLMSIGKCNKL